MAGNYWWEINLAHGSCNRNAHFYFRLRQKVCVRRDYHYVSSNESWEMVLFKYLLHDTSVPKQLSSLTQKEKVVSDLVSKAKKEAQCVGMKLCTHSKRNI